MLSAILVIIPVMLWLSLSFILHGKYWEMDYGLARGSFFAVSALYRRLFYVIFGVGISGGVLFADLRMAVPSALLIEASIYALLFNGFTAFFYEGYLHSKYRDTPLPGNIGPSNYSAWKYSLVLTLGFVSIGFFIIGVVTAANALLVR